MFRVVSFPALPSSIRLRSVAGLCLVAVLTVGAVTPAVSEAPADLQDLNLAPVLRQRMEDRILLDAYQARVYTTAVDLRAPSIVPRPRRAMERAGTIRLIETRWPADFEHASLLTMEDAGPLRGYRAPLGGEDDDGWTVRRPPGSQEGRSNVAAELVQRRLAHDGLVPTLVRCVAALGAERAVAHPEVIVRELRAVGFPTDWLSFFSPVAAGAARQKDTDWVQNLGKQLAGGTNVETVVEGAETARFRFKPSVAGFRVVTEGGEETLGVLRVQLGGGYRDGIVPGGSVDFAGRLVEAVPDLDVLMTVPGAHADNCRWLAGLCWNLRRRNQLTFLIEPFDITPWSQDNAKAGSVRKNVGSSANVAVLAPRFACRGDGLSLLAPGDSLAVVGLRGVGIEVIHSPLLFQGGNLLAFEEASTGKRTMLVGEAEISRNCALGLTRAQVLSAFETEFGVDRCIVLPPASYHIDFDVSIRSDSGGGPVIAFVNDHDAVAAGAVELGIGALETNGLLAPADALMARELLQSRRFGTLHRKLMRALAGWRDREGRLAVKVARCFGGSELDWPSARLKCFCAALDWLAAGNPEGLLAGEDPAEAGCLAALGRLRSALNEQRIILEAAGCRVVPIPSLPDFGVSINYLNAVSGRTRYLMPAFGGLYEPLDRAAAEAFSRALGAEVTVVPILCSGSGLRFGGVHCMVSALPRTDS